jgi:processive 1,2-diacylglycerol beta-glucosyltransferase
MLRVLIATVTAGGGHVAAAAALSEAWRSQRPDDLVETVDLLQSFSKLHAKSYSQGYPKLIETAPELWGAVFERTDHAELAAKLHRWRRLIPSRSQQRFVKQLEEFRADILLCTHYLPLEALRTRKQTSRPLVVSIVTDFEAHALWMAEAVDVYCVAAEHTRARLLARGAKPNQVLVTGIPISARFSQKINPAAIRRRMGLRDDLPVILILSGGFGMGPISRIVSEIDKASGEFQLLVVTGKNADLKAELSAQDWKHPTRVLGYASNMHELMGIAQLVVSKPGGLTTSEVLALGKPLMIVNPIPGQEAANSDFLLEHGAACKASRSDDLPFRIEELLKPGKLDKLGNAARALGRPEAALAVCRAVSEAALRKKQTMAIA